MKRFVEGEDRLQGALLPHYLDDYVTENNPVRVIEAFIDELDLSIYPASNCLAGNTAHRPPHLTRFSTVSVDRRYSSQVPSFDVAPLIGP